MDTSKMPLLFIPHGGGPCFFMEWDPPDTWNALGNWLRGFAATLPKPKAILMISGHWEEPRFTVQTNPHPPLIYDYSGFPPHTYRLEYPAPGSIELSESVANALGADRNPDRGFDHGAFIPLKLLYPQATIPVVQLSLKSGLDPLDHIAAGKALAGLRREGVLIISSGMSFHNLRAFGPRASAPSQAFDQWLTEAVQAQDRTDRLTKWKEAPHARFAHPREEHLIPLMVASGAAEADRGRPVFSGQVMGAQISAYQFGD